MSRRPSPSPLAYGERMAQRYGAEDVSSIVAGAPRRSEIAISEVRVDEPTGRETDPFPAEDAFMLCLLLRERAVDHYWEGGRQAPAVTLHKGQAPLHDLKRQPYLVINKPIHSLLFHVPRAALDAVADDAGAPRIGDLRYEPGVSFPDEIIRNIGLALLPAVRDPGEANRIFLDHISLAISAHVAQTYGGLWITARPRQGGLASWQERRAKDVLAADLTGATQLSDVAAAVGLSLSHFVRAFRRSTGVTPHAWLQRRRVDLAKDLLRRRTLALADIALACGFANQSHFTRVFSRAVGVTPGAWRREIEG